MSDHKKRLFFNNASQLQKSVLMDAVEEPGYRDLEVDLDDKNLVRTASKLLRFRSVRMEALENSNFQIDDISFHILLDLIAAQNSDQPKTVVDLANTHRVGESTMLRYVRHLESIRLINKSTNDDEDDQAVWTLTQTGLAVCNDLLKLINHEFESS